MTEVSKNPIGSFSNSTLKLIACVAMLCDHLGYHIFKDIEILRVIGRLAMPIFAFFIAEGCFYTKNKFKHFLLIFISGIIFLIGVYLFDGRLFGNIFLQFSISILYIYLFEFIKKIIFNGKHKILNIILSITLTISSLVVGYYLFEIFPFDYNFLTTLLPVAISLTYLKKYSKSKVINIIDHLFTRVLITSIMLILIAIDFNIPIQFYSLFAIPLILLYNNKIGTKKLKYFFYLFYPVHIIVIFFIKLFIL
jgi:hypothetical protein